MDCPSSGLRSGMGIPQPKYLATATTPDTLKAISLKEEVLKKVKGQDVKM
jgi:hypothetical protein